MEARSADLTESMNASLLAAGSTIGMSFLLFEDGEGAAKREGMMSACMSQMISARFILEGLDMMAVLWLWMETGRSRCWKC